LPSLPLPSTGKIFILLSIKTRIETQKTLEDYMALMPFLSYYPLKQGLKPMAFILISFIFA